MTETVTPKREYTSKGGMSGFGWIIALGMVILLAPLLPLYLLLKLVDVLVGEGDSTA